VYYSCTEEEKNGGRVYTQKDKKEFLLTMAIEILHILEKSFWIGQTELGSNLLHLQGREASWGVNLGKLYTNALREENLGRGVWGRLH